MSLSGNDKDSAALEQKNRPFILNWMISKGKNCFLQCLMDTNDKHIGAACSLLDSLHQFIVSDWAKAENCVVSIQHQDRSEFMQNRVSNVDIKCVGWIHYFLKHVFAFLLHPRHIIIRVIYVRTWNVNQPSQKWLQQISSTNQQARIIIELCLAFCAIVSLLKNCVCGLNHVEEKKSLES